MTLRPLLYGAFFLTVAGTRLSKSPRRMIILCTAPVISIIDDDASVRLATDNLVRSFGYTVHVFSSAKDFLSSVHLNETSCVITDVQMPIMNGIELHTVLLSQGHRVPFIFMTAFPDETVRERALKAGAVCFLTKPFDGRSLIGCLDSALKGRGGETIE
jgi:FixJ family two-component response regulator